MDTVLSQFLALFTFFLFPIIQFLLLKHVSKDIGRPELWYLPQYGFRLVIRNADSSKNLYDVKYKVYSKVDVEYEVNLDYGVVEDKPSVGATIYENIEQNEMPFLLAREDKAMLCFKLEGESKSNLYFCKTDYFGAIESKKKVEPNFKVVAEYTAMIDNPFNFDVRVLKRVELDFDQFVESYIKINNGLAPEQCIDLKNVISGGK